MCQHLLAQIDHLDVLIAELDARIAQLTRSHDDDLTNLDTIPGIGRKAAEIIWAETAGEMAQFTTVAHLVSWIGVCPGMDESDGVNKSAKTRRGNAHLKEVLGSAAVAAIRGKDSYYSVYYRRIAARRGGKRALVALMQKIVIAIWHVLKHMTAFQDLGADYLPKRESLRPLGMDHDLLNDQNDKSRVNREVYARICGGRRVKLPPPTRPPSPTRTTPSTVHNRQTRQGIHHTGMPALIPVKLDIIMKNLETKDR